MTICRRCPARAQLVPAVRLPGQRSERLKCPACDARYRVIGSSLPSLPIARTDGGRVASGFAHEAKDCAVRAYAVAKGCPYAEAHARFKAAGRPDRRGTPTPVSLAVMGPATEDYPRGMRITVATWLRRHRGGRWVVHVSGHAFAVVDGVQQDTGANKPLARVKRAWRLS